MYLSLKTDIEQSYYNVKLSSDIIPVLEKHVALLKKEVENRKKRYATILELVIPLKKAFQKEKEKEFYIYIQNSEFIKIKAILGEL